LGARRQGTVGAAWSAALPNHAIFFANWSALRRAPFVSAPTPCASIQRLVCASTYPHTAAESSRAAMGVDGEGQWLALSIGARCRLMSCCVAASVVCGTSFLPSSVVSISRDAARVAVTVARIRATSAPIHDAEAVSCGPNDELLTASERLLSAETKSWALPACGRPPSPRPWRRCSGRQYPRVVRGC